ncbi:hypothetical protein V5O48_013004 [Marasmius crinis-equi]|uniref:N-acetyltransferase domain-containing protein n=1 Tax=Marasmius crinis-equi TaxID=585013 RepID=A0ABR3F1B3_9AGAR
MTTDTKISQISVDQTIHLRHTILWPTFPIAHVKLPEDQHGFHFGVFLEGLENEAPGPVTVISLFVEPLPNPNADTQTKAARFRKFACDPPYQGRGIGSQLLQYVFEHAKTDLGVGVVWCDARLETAKWYERRGMCRFGETFFKGPVEYVRMKVEAAQGAGRGYKGWRAEGRRKIPTLAPDANVSDSALPPARYAEKGIFSQIRPSWRVAIRGIGLHLEGKMRECNEFPTTDQDRPLFSENRYKPAFSSRFPTKANVIYHHTIPFKLGRLHYPLPHPPNHLDYNQHHYTSQPPDTMSITLIDVYEFTLALAGTIVSSSFLSSPLLSSPLLSSPLLSSPLLSSPPRSLQLTRPSTPTSSPQPSSTISPSTATATSTSFGFNTSQPNANGSAANKPSANASGFTIPIGGSRALLRVGGG